MRHFDHLTPLMQDELFSVRPTEFDSASSRTVLANALGATLYVPGVRQDVAGVVRRRAAEGVRSMVVDLEDAVADRDVDQAVRNVTDALIDLHQDEQRTLLFVRVRTPDHIRQIMKEIDTATGALTGFVLPKFSAATGGDFLAEIVSAAERIDSRLLAMPVLETPDVLYRESRDRALCAIRDLLADYRQIVLALRFGATDLCGLYGLRRDRDLTIYHVGVVAELISEVVNHLGRADGTGYTITGPVWEYFAGHERMFRPQLRSTPFEDRHERSLRHRLVANDFDGLIREIVLDRTNGLTGKTVIHPTHVAAVHALSVVPHEEYSDAADILDAEDDGVRASGYRNKMNEIRPHRRWAGAHPRASPGVRCGQPRDLARRHPGRAAHPMTARLRSDRTDLSGWVGSRFGVVLTTHSSPVGLELDDLVGLALRRNPRRAHLLVSTVLGKHVPVDPAVAISIGRLLGELVAVATGTGRTSLAADWVDPVHQAVRAGHPGELLDVLDAAQLARPESTATVLGFAETATALGHLVADQLQAGRYLHSTRRAVPGVEVTGTFQEGHSHATDHHLMPIPGTLLEQVGPLVLVDDELSTGRTAMGTIEQAHERFPRSNYVVASLIDLRSAQDQQALQALAHQLGCTIDVVSLVRGSVELPAGLIEAVTAAVSSSDGLLAVAPTAGRPPTAASPPTTLGWPPDVPDGGRHGFLSADRSLFGRAVQEAAAQVATVVREALPDNHGDVLVIGTEELMYLPLRVAHLLAAGTRLVVRYQSTTRSPVLAVNDDGYPIRRLFSFTDPEGDGARRYLYNGYRSAPPDLVILLTDAAADTTALRGPEGTPAVLRAAGLRVALVVLQPVQPSALAARRGSAVVHAADSHPPVAAISSAMEVISLLTAIPAAHQSATEGTIGAVREDARGPALPSPLVGPSFGSYQASEVQWLLTDLSAIKLEAPVVDREADIQAGTAHYAESLPVEYLPDRAYRDLFDQVLDNSAERLAAAIGRVTELVLAERGDQIVLASLARAGTPIGVLIRRWAMFRRSVTLPHYALSIVRGRGIDTVALRYVAAHHDPRSVVFVDGWTGKGAIAKELTVALAKVREQTGLDFNDDLAVLADPGHCVRTFGTRDDFLIASACLNSTVSGLVSRTVLNDRYIGPTQFHGAKFYRELAGDDVSMVLLDRVTAAFPAVVGDVLADVPRIAVADREVTFARLGSTRGDPGGVRDRVHQFRQAGRG